MDVKEYKIKTAVRCLAIAMIDAFGGRCDIHENNIECLLNDNEEIACLMIESTGEVICIDGIDYKELKKAIDLWKVKNPEKFDKVMKYLERQA